MTEGTGGGVMAGASGTSSDWRRATLALCAGVGLLAVSEAARAQVVVKDGQILQIQNGKLVPVAKEGAAADPPEKFATPEARTAAFEQIVKDLGSNDFTARQKASERLSGNEQFDLALLETALKRNDLTLEARSRLMAVARQRFFRTSRAALGFQFGGTLRDRIVVGQTFAKFPSAKLLQEGDMIVGADGYKLEGPSARPLLQAIIVSHDPGEILKLTIRRGAQKLDLDVPLGNFADLDNGGATLMEDKLTRAWRIRAQSRLGATSEPIRVAGAPTDTQWGPTEEQAQRKMAAMMQRESNEPQVQLAGGGMPRAARVADEGKLAEVAPRQQVLIINGQARIIQGGFGMRGMMGDWDPEAGLQPVGLQEELAMLLRHRQELDQRIANQPVKDGVFEDPALRNPADARHQRDLIVKQMDAIEAEMREKAAAAPAPTDGKHSAADANQTP